MIEEKDFTENQLTLGYFQNHALKINEFIGNGVEEMDIDIYKEVLGYAIAALSELNSENEKLGKEVSEKENQINALLDQLNDVMIQSNKSNKE